MNIITGYKLHTRDFSEVENALILMQQTIEKIAVKKYHELLSEEVEILIDNISLNIIPRPTDRTVLDIAQESLNQKIAYASGNNLPIEYNMNVSVHVLTSEDYTYFRLNAAYDIYHKELSKLPGLIPCSVRNGEGSAENKEIWEYLMKKYETGIQPCITQLFPKGPIAVDKKKLKFSSPLQRSKRIARHNLTNKYLAMYAGNKEIPNYKLMEYMDRSLEALTSLPRSKSELTQMEVQLRTILPNITIELVDSLPELASQAEQQ